MRHGSALVVVAALLGVGSIPLAAHHGNASFDSHDAAWSRKAFNIGEPDGSTLSAGTLPNTPPAQ